jgi:uncharacterized protein YlxW (UPF0749 family)
MKNLSISKTMWSCIYTITNIIILILGIINAEIPENSNNKILSFIIANKFFLILFVSFIISIIINLNQVIKQNNLNIGETNKNEKIFLEEIKQQKKIIDFQNEQINLQNEKIEFQNKRIKQLENNKALNKNSLSQLKYEIIEEW